MNRYWNMTMEDYAMSNPAIMGVGGLYNAHFGLKMVPFSLTPDTQFFFNRASCQDAFNTLILAARSGEGFIKVVGEVGTGKTLLCRKFLDGLGSHFVTAYIPNPYLEPMTLLLAVADELGVSYGENVNQHQLLKALTEFFIDTFSRYQRTVVVCLDEAQALPTESLEALRLLTNLETEKRKLVQVVLFGQPELDTRLAEPSIRQLRQRIGFSSTLQPMTLKEVDDYISHRLHVAGYKDGRLFAFRAVKRIYQASGGIPRLVNILSHKALASAYGEGRQRVEVSHAKLAIADTEAAKQHYVYRRLRRVLALSGIGCGVLALVGMLLWGYLA